MFIVASQSKQYSFLNRHFVPNLTIGPPVIKCLRKKTTAFLDCHCMVSDPGFWVDDMAKAGASQVTFHYESNIGKPIPPLKQRKYYLIKNTKMIMRLWQRR